MLLLDTHILLWWINGTAGKLPSSLVATTEDAESLAVSAISCFEIEWLARHGRIELEISLDEWFSGVFSDAGVNCLPITAEIARLAASLPEHHKDPQDRLIIATSIIHNLPVISADKQFLLYDKINSLLITA
ncbi:MAG: type II toxin-antitoxin system VapC family toxin [Geobacter sp.]|nr:type II toxin-antitoxin system VapC family toxin [Geobacter sp.]